MAKELFSLFGIVSIKGVNNVVNGVNKVEKEIKKTQRQIANFGRQVGAVGQKLTKTLTVPLGIAALAVTKFGADFENAMTKSTAIMGDLSDEMRGKMEKAARQVALTSTHSAKQAADSYFYLASAGLDAAKSIQALPMVASFAQAGTFDLALATDLLTDAQSALGLSSQDTAKHMSNMARVSDVLVKANTLANATVQQFSESLTNKGGAALRLLNKDITEGVAVLAAYADQGNKGTRAGESLNIVLRDLQKASINNRKAFDEAGVSVYDASGNMNNMADIVGDLEKRFKGMSDEQKRAELMTLGFTDKSVSATMALLGTSDAIRRYQASLEDAGGITNEVAQKQLKSFTAQLLLLKNKLIDVAIDFSKMLLPVLKDQVIPVVDKVAKGIKKISSWFTGMSSGMQKTIVGWIALAAAIGPVLMLVGKAIIISKGLITTILLLKNGMLGLNIIMSANPVGAVIAAFAALTAVGIYLYNNWDDLKVKFINVWGMIVYHAKQSTSVIKEQFYKIVAASTEMIANMTKNIPFVGKAVKDLSGNYKELARAEKQARLEQQMAYSKQKLKIAADKKEVEIIEKAKIAIKEKAEISSKSTTWQTEEAEKLARDKAKFESDWNTKYLDSSQSRIEILLREKQIALEEAEKLGAEKVNIKRYYDEQLLIAQQEHNTLMEELQAEELEKQLEKDEAEKERRQEKFDLFAQMYQTAVNAMSTISGAFYNRDIANIDKKKKKEIEAIKASTLEEEEKEKKISEIEAKAEKETLERKRRQAIADKAYALFQIGINTAVAIMKVLSTAATATGRAIQVALITAASIAQTVAVAAQPLPMADGAFVKSHEGGTIAQIGEGSQDELVFPLKKGVDLLADKLISKVMGVGDAAVTTGESIGDSFTYNIHVGTLIGNEDGYRELERNIRKYRFQEDQRRGE